MTLKIKPLILLTLCAAAAAQVIPPNSRDSDRGVTPTQRPSQTMDRGRMGTETAVESKPFLWRGILVDAGCQDRSLTNLKRAASLAPAAPPDKSSSDKADTPKGAAARNGAVNDKGVKVDSSTVRAERAIPMETRTPDHLTREMDPSCALTAQTKAFALLLPNGTLLNLDEGGNTMAYEAFQSSPQGQAILNGRGNAEKPHATIKGTRRGDQLEVQTVRLK
jgi:hypothetical protein